MSVEVLEAGCLRRHLDEQHQPAGSVLPVGVGRGLGREPDDRRADVVEQIGMPERLRPAAWVRALQFPPNGRPAVGTSSAPRQTAAGSRVRAPGRRSLGSRPRISVRSVEAHFRRFLSRRPWLTRSVHSRPGSGVDISDSRPGTRRRARRGHGRRCCAAWRALIRSPCGWCVPECLDESIPRLALAMDAKWPGVFWPAVVCREQDRMAASAEAPARLAAGRGWIGELGA